MTTVNQTLVKWIDTPVEQAKTRSAITPRPPFWASPRTKKTWVMRVAAVHARRVLRKMTFDPDRQTLETSLGLIDSVVVLRGKQAELFKIAQRSMINRGMWLRVQQDLESRTKELQAIQGGARVEPRTVVDRVEDVARLSAMVRGAREACILNWRTNGKG